MKQLFLLFATLCASFLVSSSAFAVDPYVLTVAPSVSDISLDPGASSELAITVANQGSEDMNLTVTPAPYAVHDNSYDAIYTPLAGRTPVVDWLNITSATPSSLAAGKYYDLNLKITVPADTPPGGYSASILVTTSPSSEQSGGISATQRVAHIVYITVNGDVERSGEVVPQPILLVETTTRQQSVGFTASNTGGSNEIATTSVKITDIFGRVQYDESQTRYVLPGTQRTISYAWQPQGLFGVYKIERTCEIVDTPCDTPAKWQLYMSQTFVLLLFTGAAVYTVFMWLRRVQKRKKR